MQKNPMITESSDFTVRGIKEIQAPVIAAVNRRP